jgi:hypothetical protein
MSSIAPLFRWLLRRVSALLVVVALATRVRDALRRRRQASAKAGRAEREVLPSLLDAHPGATSAPRRPIGLRAVPLDRIVGTMRHPSQNTADFLPMPRLRGQNWRARWQRINRAMDRLVTLPPVDLVQVGEDYYVEDGHNRVAAARHAGAVEIDADVTQLLLPGVTRPGLAALDASTIAESTEVRQAATGRRSPTIERRSAADSVSRRDLVRPDDPRFDDRS